MPPATESMDIKVRVVVFVLSMLWLLFVLRMVKRRKIWERYAIFWVYLGFAVLLVPLFVDVFDSVLGSLGVTHPPSFFFLVSILGILLLLLQLSVEITTLVRRSRDTVQELAILDERVRRLEKELGKPHGDESVNAGAGSEAKR